MLFFRIRSLTHDNRGKIFTSLAPISLVYRVSLNIQIIVFIDSQLGSQEPVEALITPVSDLFPNLRTRFVRCPSGPCVLFDENKNFEFFF